jgi:acrylyl-CoA reductase (NADPH)
MPDQAIWLEKSGTGTEASFRELDDVTAGTADGDVVVAVEWSTLNYKDALAITGSSPVVRTWPMIPGIDLAGTVESSGSGEFKPRQRVVLNGWGHGELSPGGLATRARVPAQHLLALPEPLSTRDAMAIGTAGYTAALCLLALERHGIEPASGPVLVTGAGGGVGGFAIALLAKRGYQVTASTGRPAETARLQRLGAAAVIDRAELSEKGKPLQKERWAGVIDSAGSATLANACAQTRYGGTVAACGLAQGMDFPASVAPFILRGVTLAGIDSVMAPRTEREAAWALLASHLDDAIVNDMATEIPLSGAIDGARRLLDGQVPGRLLVRIR